MIVKMFCCQIIAIIDHCLPVVFCLTAASDICNPVVSDPSFFQVLVILVNYCLFVEVFSDLSFGEPEVLFLRFLTTVRN